MTLRKTWMATEQLNSERLQQERIICAKTEVKCSFQFKELCRAMSKPKEDDWNKLKRLARYLVGKERCTIDFKYQSKLEGVTVWADSDLQAQIL